MIFGVSFVLYLMKFSAGKGFYTAPFLRNLAVNSLFCRAVRICSNTFFLNRQISTVSKFMLWNGFPASFQCAILRKLKSKHNSNNPALYSNTSSANNFSNNIADENISKIWVRIPFLGKQGEYLVKKTNPQITTQSY